MRYTYGNEYTDSAPQFSFDLRYYHLGAAELVTLPLDLVAMEIQSDGLRGGSITLHTNDLQWLKMIIQNAREEKGK